MPLLDHFHAPISTRQYWESFHSLWIAALVERLNERLLPPDFVAQAQVHIGGRIEVDVATLEAVEQSPAGNGPADAGVAVQTWAPPKTALAFPAAFPDEVEIQVLSIESGPVLVAAIEIVSPGNKDRDEARRAFVGKCTAYLAQGVGLIVVDTVTSRSANLHDELMRFLGLAEPFLFAPGVSLYTSAYRPRRVPDDRIELWPVPLAVGAALPTLPLALRNSITVPIDLEDTYTQARRRSRL
jgi:hypothetical protein